MKELFEVSQGTFRPCLQTLCKFKDIKTVKINAALAGSVLRGAYWNVITCFRARACVVYDDVGCVIHYSFVIPRCPKFTFLRGGGKRDIEIGPCATKPEFRGMGLYPYVLSHIVGSQIHGDQKAYMIIEERNESSRKGILKVGFHKVGVIKKNRFKQYVVCRTE